MSNPHDEVACSQCATPISGDEIWEYGDDRMCERCYDAVQEMIDACCYDLPEPDLE